MPVLRAKLIRLALLLVVLNAAVFVLLPRHRYLSIVIHHTASDRDDYESIRVQHRRRGWSDAAYHFVLSNGSTGTPLGMLEPTRRYRDASTSVATKNRWYNATGLHLCVVGNYETSELPDPLRPSLAHAVRALQKRYRVPDGGIRLHRDCSRTLCPGRNLTRENLAEWIERSADQCPSALRRQHETAIESTDLAPGRFSRPLLHAMALSSAAAMACFVRWPRPRRRKRRRRRPKVNRT